MFFRKKNIIKSMGKEERVIVLWKGEEGKTFFPYEGKEYAKDEEIQMLKSDYEGYIRWIPLQLKQSSSHTGKLKADEKSI